MGRRGKDEITNATKNCSNSNFIYHRLFVPCRVTRVTGVAESYVGQKRVANGKNVRSVHL